MTDLLAGSSSSAGNNSTSATDDKPYWKEAGLFELRKEYQAMRQGHAEPRQHGLKSASGITAQGIDYRQDAIQKKILPCSTPVSSHVKRDGRTRRKKRFLKNYKFILFWKLSIRFDEKNRIYRQIHYKTFGILKKPFYFCSTQSGNLRISLT